jgi:hypothetical protein
MWLLASGFWLLEIFFAFDDYRSGEGSTGFITVDKGIHPSSNKLPYRGSQEHATTKSCILISLWLLAHPKLAAGWHRHIYILYRGSPSRCTLLQVVKRRSRNTEKEVENPAEPHSIAQHTYEIQYRRNLFCRKSRSFAS